MKTNKLKIAEIVLWSLLFGLNFSVFSRGLDRDPFALHVKELSRKDNSQNKIAKTIRLKYLKAARLKTLLQSAGNHLLSKQGSVIAEPISNRIWFYDTPNHLQRILKFVRAMDTVSPQILIQARIVNIDSDYLHELGIKFGTQYGNIFSDAKSGMQVGSIQFPLAYLPPNQRLDVEIAALTQQGKANIIASPQLITENRLPADIESGEEIPYQEKTSSGATNVAFKKAVLGLKVTPMIVTNKKLQLKLKITQDKLSNRLVRGVPGIQTQALTTQVLVRSKQTIVLGGVYQTVNEREIVRVPLISSIPIVGRIFQHHKLRRRRRLLLVFITPTILSD